MEEGRKKENKKNHRNFFFCPGANNFGTIALVVHKMKMRWPLNLKGYVYCKQAEYKLFWGCVFPPCV